MKATTWFIFGASSAIARAFSQVVAGQGDNLILLGRDDEDLSITAKDLTLRHNIACKTVCMDLNSSEAHKQIFDICKPLDSVSFFFAYSVMYEEANYDHDVIKNTFTTNTISTVQLLNQVAQECLPEKKVNHIIVLSSVAGDRGRKKNCLYGASKAALNTYIQGWRARNPEVSLLLVKPGFIDTQMTFGKEGVPFAASPHKLAKACIHAVKRNKKALYYPRFWKYIMWAVKVIPEKIFIRLPI